MEAVSGAKCETSDGTAWLPRHMFTRRRRQKELHAQNISWYQLTHNRLRLFWDVLGLLKNLELLGSVFPQFRMSGAQCLMTSWRPCYNAAWICSEIGRWYSETRKTVFENWELTTPGMMICERSILHKAETHFHPFASHGFSKKHAKAAMAITVKVSMPTKVLLREGGELDPSWFYSHSIYCRKRVADLILDPWLQWVKVTMPINAFLAEDGKFDPSWR